MLGATRTMLTFCQMIAIESDDSLKVFWEKTVSLQYCKYPETQALGTHSFTLVADITNEVGSKMHFKRGR